jgi:hypothetical protein
MPGTVGLQSLTVPGIDCALREGFASWLNLNLRPLP